MFLLETHVGSELRKVSSGKAHPNVIAFNETVDPAETFISTVVVHELEIGVRSVVRSDAMAGKVLRHWLKEVVIPAFSVASCRWTKRPQPRRQNGMFPIRSRSMI
ncbi:putative nucleic acid-binding protein [Mesorhizobium shonense]|uniref:Nucleic acid-binding protein n=1 Tax=Mesorhizobium shonense TaxID=1209948 RepID=A0ABV2HWW0_9HYPH